MPLLPKEIDLFPDDLFALPAGAFPWHVARGDWPDAKAWFGNVFRQGGMQ